MNREIKFRIWDNEKRIFKTNINIDYLIPDNESGENLNNILSNNIYTFQQFTGLFDASGREIYEGDILGPNSKTWRNTVIFESGRFKLNGWNLDVYDNLIVLGNSNDNPELLDD